MSIARAKEMLSDFADTVEADRIDLGKKSVRESSWYHAAFREVREELEKIDEDIIKKVTVREVIEMLSKCDWDDECTCINTAVNEKIKMGKVEFDEDLGPEIDEDDIDSYKYSIVGTSQFVGINGKGVQIIFDSD